MKRRSSSSRRHGAVVVESAFVYPVMLFLLFGIILGALGVFRYQEVASLAREGARYASVHGGQYASDNGKSLTTEADVNNAIGSQAVSMDPTQLDIDCSWSSSGQVSGSTVTVTVTYQWIPGLAGMTTPINLNSTSTMIIVY